MSKGQTKKTREAAGNRRKLTRAEKKQIAAVIRQAKGDGKAHTAQQTIPYLAMYPDGICKVTEKRYSKCVVFEDINYQLAQADDKTAIFENWCDFLNYFDASVSVQLSFINQGARKEKAQAAIEIPAQDDAFNSIRREYADMLKNQLEKGNNGLEKCKYITFSIEADNLAAAKARLSRIETDVLNNFKVLGVTARPMNGQERLNVLHGIFHPEGEPFRFSWDWLVPSGLTTKDFIAPSSFRFGDGRTFRMGRKLGAVSFLEILAPELNDRMLSDILDLENGIIVNLHIRSIDQSEAIKTIKRKITDLDKMKIEEQKKAVRSGYDMDIIPSDLATFGSEAKNLLQDLQSRNERMFLLTFLVVNMADTKRKLDNDIFATAGFAQKNNCALTRLDYLQEAGFMSSIPLGENLIPIQRGLTTSSTAIFIPFITQELFQRGAALYYGLNALSNNMILCDRKQLKNPNGLILGTPGSGKSFAAKREMTNAFLITDDDIIICDPEAEYFSLVQRLGGQVIRLSPAGKGMDGKPQYVNPMDINLNYSEDDNPLALKSDFILSLCELVIGGKEGLQPVEKTVIDRAVRNVYRPFLADPDPAKMPILGDLYNELLKQPEPEAARIAAALELYVSGSLNVFNHRTNVELSNRLVCFDIKQLGKQLKKLGMLIVQDQVWNRVTVNRAEKKATRYYIPWQLAFALRSDGWYLRSDIIWLKENPMPESCRDRPSRCYEHIFLLTKSKKYYYDAAAIAEPIAPGTAARYRQGRSAGHKYAEEVPGQGKVQGINQPRSGSYYDDALMPTTRNKRDVWLINTVPYKGGHFAAYPPKLAETCILAGCPKGGVVIDPFFGSGTTGLAAQSLDRRYIGIELNAEYCALAGARIGGGNT